MKRWMFLFFLLLLCLLQGKVEAVDYSIPSYKAVLELSSDNTAIFTQDVVYDFDDDFKGQYISLGEAGNVPKGFSIELLGVEVEKNNQKVVSPYYHLENWGDGYAVKVYNAGQSGDRVTIHTRWKIHHVLSIYEDIAVLNWKPITDWDKGLNKIDFKVVGLDGKSALFVHRGYFQPDTLVEKIGVTRQFVVNNLPEKSTIEIYGYWETKAFTEVEKTETLSGKYLERFEAVESDIEEKTNFYRSLVQLYLPLFYGVLLLGAGLLYRFFVSRVELDKTELSRVLYAPPADLAPLILAAHVYSTDMSEVNPAEKGKGKLSFGQLVQATLLDLIDRKVIGLSRVENLTMLTLLDTAEDITGFEHEFLELAFGNKKKCSLEDLFNRYRISKQLYGELMTGEEEKIFQRAGLRITNALERDLQRLTNRVHLEINQLGLPNLYRPLSMREKMTLYLSIGLSISVCCASILTFLYLLLLFSIYPIAVLVIGIASALLLYVQCKQAQMYGRDGVLTEEGRLQFQLWNGFENMLKDISRLNQTQIEGIVLWNRMLVYATLLGHAEKVSRFLRIRQIDLGLSDLNNYILWGWNDRFSSMARNLSDYGEIARDASHFSVSSGGSGGSFGGGGGFSGGGGGGGGGAF